jgi:hypothetical protein
MEWVVKIESKNGWGEVETIEVGRLARRPTGLSAEQFGLTLTEGKSLLGELGRLILQTQMEEFITCARVCGDRLKLGLCGIGGPARSKLCLGPSLSTRLVSEFAPAGPARASWMSPSRPWPNCFRTDARRSSVGFRPS